MEGGQPSIDGSGSAAVRWVADRVEMFIDLKTFTAANRQGVDPGLFRDGMIPFKGIRVNAAGDAVHDVAAKGYAMAHRSDKVSGPPVALVSLTVSPVMSWVDLLNGAVTIDARTSTYGLRRTAPADRLSLHWLEGDVGQTALDQGYAVLEAEKMLKMEE